MQPVRCPKCNRLLGYFKGKGTIRCPRCRDDKKVCFDTEKNIVEFERPERHDSD